MNIGNSYQIITQKEHDIQGISDLEPFIIGLFKLNEPELAEKCLDAFSKSAMTFGQYDNLSKCYFKIKKYEKSIKYG